MQLFASPMIVALSVTVNLLLGHLGAAPKDTRPAHLDTYACAQPTTPVDLTAAQVAAAVATVDLSDAQITLTLNGRTVALSSSAYRHLAAAHRQGTGVAVETYKGTLIPERLSTRDGQVLTQGPCLLQRHTPSGGAGQDRSGAASGTARTVTFNGPLITSDADHRSPVHGEADLAILLHRVVIDRRSSGAGEQANGQGRDEQGSDHSGHQGPPGMLVRGMDVS